ncbi:MAG TPA: DUF2442 domain-containing protein [Pirellulales bacterium]|nr:DUF2442 domain-containing protein [Pirellulales bacterium]
MRRTDPITAEGFEVTSEALILTLADGSLSIPWSKCSAKLAAASDAERRQAELSPGGYGIHWPLLDEDLSVGGLVRA